MISAGAGAGLAAAFNAPLSGLVFVLEELRRDFQPIVFGAAFVAAVAGGIVLHLASGPFPVFAVPSYAAPPLASLPGLGFAAGLLGVLFNRGVLAALEVCSRLAPGRSLWAVGITGALVGLVGWFSPPRSGPGIPWPSQRFEATCS